MSKNILSFLLIVIFSIHLKNSLQLIIMNNLDFFVTSQEFLILPDDYRETNYKLNELVIVI